MKRETKPKKRMKPVGPPRGRGKPLIDYWSHSSLVAYLRNPLAWYKRYVLKMFDTPRSPAGVIGGAAHVALEQYYLGAPIEAAVETGLTNLRSVPDFEINFGVAKSAKAKKEKRAAMERDYLRAVGFYLARPPKHKVVGVEVRGFARVPGQRLRVKAISDLVVESKGNPGCLDIVDHKFVDSFSKEKESKALFWLQAIFNYYTVSETYGKPVKRFIIIECKKTQNKDGKPQLRKYSIEYEKAQDVFQVFHMLLADATREISRTRKFLPNPSDMFEGQDSFDLYRLGLIDEAKAFEDTK